MYLYNNSFSIDLTSKLFVKLLVIKNNTDLNNCDYYVIAWITDVWNYLHLHLAPINYLLSDNNTITAAFNHLLEDCHMEYFLIKEINKFIWHWRHSFIFHILQHHRYGLQKKPPNSCLILCTPLSHRFIFLFLSCCIAIVIGWWPGFWLAVCWYVADGFTHGRSLSWGLFLNCSLMVLLHPSTTSVLVLYLKFQFKTFGLQFQTILINVGCFRLHIWQYFFILSFERNLLIRLNYLGIFYIAPRAYKCFSCVF